MQEDRTMMKHEFERLAGYEVSAEDYNKIIEPMYMATDLSKEEFVNVIDKKRFALKPLAKMERWMKKIAAHLEETCTHYTDYEAKEELEKTIMEYAHRIGATNWWMTDEMRFSCYYPTKVEFYRFGETIKTINF